MALATFKVNSAPRRRAASDKSSLITRAAFSMTSRRGRTNGDSWALRHSASGGSPLSGLNAVGSRAATAGKTVGFGSSTKKAAALTIPRRPVCDGSTVLKGECAWSSREHDKSMPPEHPQQVLQPFRDHPIQGNRGSIRSGTRTDRPGWMLSPGSRFGAWADGRRFRFKSYCQFYSLRKRPYFLYPPP